MGERSVKKETKKPKKSASKSPVSGVTQQVSVQPQLIKKEKKVK